MRREATKPTTGDTARQAVSVIANTIAIIFVPGSWPEVLALGMLGM